MTDVAFCVIYRWTIKPGREKDFREAWEALTRALRSERGSLGSRLHRARDGTWMAYAQWPSEEAWRAAFGDSPDAGAMAQMRDCIEHAQPPILATPVSDLLELKRAPGEG